MATVAFAPWDRLRSAAVRRARDWTRRRQGTDGEQFVLHRQRIYILPTRLGVGFAVMVVAMVAGGMNYGNNLGIALGLLLGSLGLVAMHHCHGNLLGLGVRLAGTEPAFAGGHAVFRLRIDNPTRAARARLALDADGARTVLLDVAARSDATAELEVSAATRGTLHVQRFEIATRYPFGLFKAWSIAHPDFAALVYPAPAPRGTVAPGRASESGGSREQGEGGEDFAGLQTYRPGDSLGRIAWKAHARGLGLHSKRYAGSRVTSQVFDWESLPQLGVEARLSLLTRWIVDAHARGEAYALRMPAARVASASGRPHRQQCLALLALHPGPARGAGSHD